MLRQIVSRKSKYLPYLIFGVLSLLIMGQLLRSGYVLTLDMVFAPHNVTRFDFTGSLYGLNSYDVYINTGLPITGLFKVISYVIPMWVLEKIFMFAMFFLAGISAYKLVPVKSQAARYYAGLLYMINPFVYVRFLAGHWFLLAAYAILPFAIIAFLSFLNEPKRVNTIKMVLWVTAIATFNIQILLLTLFVFLVIFVFHLFQKKDIQYCWRMVQRVGIASVAFIAINLYWILPILTAETTLLQNIGLIDLQVFSANDPTHGISPSIASMYGFWREGYPDVRDKISWWFILIAFIILLALIGFIFNFHKKEQSTVANSMVLVAIIAFVLGTGVNGSYTVINDWLFQHFPLLKVFRDTHKFVSLIALAYVYLGALGIDIIFSVIPRERFKNVIAVSLIVVVLVIPVVYSYQLFNGGLGHLTPVDYPKDWYAIEKYLNKDKDDFNVLFFPWHLKADYSWLRNKEKRLTSPAQAFFSKPVIHGENIELGTIYTQSQDPIQHYIKFLFQNRRKIENFGELMIPINVKYVILAKDSDYKSYDFLFQQQDLELVKETSHLVVFKNTHQVARIYEIGDITYINDWKELLKVSKEEDISQKLYIMGSQSETVPADSEYKAISYTQENPAHLLLDRQPNGDYLVLTESYSKPWAYGDNTRLEAYGVTNAFITEDAEVSELMYRRFYSTYLPAYCISITSFALIIIVALYRFLTEHGNKLSNQERHTK